MGGMRTPMAVLVASLVATFFPCAAFAQPVQPTLKLQVIAGRPVVDGVYLNGQGPYRFLLDTGTQVNMLKPQSTDFNHPERFFSNQPRTMQLVLKYSF